MGEQPVLLAFIASLTILCVFGGLCFLIVQLAKIGDIDVDFEAKPDNVKLKTNVKVKNHKHRTRAK